jgi:GT2 family glycosyltransferase
VTVTYGDRVGYLSTVMDAVFRDEVVESAIIVNNGSSSDFESLKSKWGTRLSFVDLGKNTGSASGYAAGIQFALEAGAPFIWLMDDDNAPCEGAVRALCARLGSLIGEYGVDRAAVAAVREARANADRDASSTIDSGFLGFHVMRLGRKLLRRLFDVRPSADSLQDHQPYRVQYVPYGGFLAAREVFARLGLPHKPLVLYGDDWDYTMRLTRLGGVIEMVPSAVIRDIDLVWYKADKRTNIFVQSLLLGSDFRVYYTFRNHVWLNIHNFVSHRLLYLLNKATFSALLLGYALRYRRIRRFALIMQAISHGERGKLGVSDQFPLP